MHARWWSGGPPPQSLTVFATGLRRRLWIFSTVIWRAVVSAAAAIACSSCSVGESRTASSPCALKTYWRIRGEFEHENHPSRQQFFGEQPAGIRLLADCRQGSRREHEARGRKALIAAYEAGYTLFDHADIYGSRPGRDHLRPGAQGGFRNARPGAPGKQVRYSPVRRSCRRAPIVTTSLPSTSFAAVKAP